MNRAAFRQLMAQAHRLTAQQRAQLQSRLQETAPSQPNQVIEGLEQRVQHNPQCPHCDGEYIIRHGREQGIQRYRCKECGKTFRVRPPARRSRGCATKTNGRPTISAWRKA